MKKVLIFLEKNKIEPKGGPYGYNYNLLKGLKEVNNEYIIDFLDDLPNEQFFKKGYLNAVEKKMKFFKPYPKKFMEQFNEYDVIHFHTSAHMYRARDFLKKYTGKVLFTSHSPMLLSKEMYEDASEKSKKYFSHFFKKLSCVDEYAFSRADYIVYPCEEAEEPYFNEGIYKTAKKTKDFLYMPTGVVDCKEKIKQNKVEYRSRCGIPEDAFVFSYVGRHNEVKGYARLKDAAQKILEKNKNVYFLIGGKEAPLTGLNNNRWIEIGYTSDPYSLINASDFFILPNLQTYFDLVFLEVISLGKSMIVSDTGGNKYFKKYHSDSIGYFKNTDELLSKMNDALSRKSNFSGTRKIYDNDFTCKKFAERYISVLDSVIRNEEKYE